MSENKETNFLKKITKYSHHPIPPLHQFYSYKGYQMWNAEDCYN